VDIDHDQPIGEVLDGGKGAGTTAPAAPAPAAKGETSATPAAAVETKTTQQAGDDDDLWADPKDPTISRDVYVATRKKWREKAQQTERQLAETQGRLATFEKFSQGREPATQNPKQPTAEELEQQYWQDPVKFTATLSQQVAQQVRAESEQRFLRSAAARARRTYQDYEQTVQVFAQAAQANPALEQACLQSEDPAEYAYQSGKAYIEAQKHGGSLQAMRAAMEKELRGQLEAEFRKKGVLSAAEQASTSSAGASGSGATSPIDSDDDEPMSAIIGR
jgi:hypothetical protein